MLFICSFAVALAYGPLAAEALRLFPSPGVISANVPAACREALSTDIACTGESCVTALCVITGDALHRSAAAEGAAPPYRTFSAPSTSAAARPSTACCRTRNTSRVAARSPMNLVWGYDMAGFGDGRVTPESFSTLLSRCGASPTKYTYTHTPLPLPTSTRNATDEVPPAPTCRGTVYTVKQGDTCASISSASSVATDRLIALNALDYSCSCLAPGTQLCLQDTCTLYTVQPGDTCTTLLANKTFHHCPALVLEPDDPV
ncbi:hypothetical protein MAPG_10481 [Magnaporthiopsis poae ATCC 64411]|uniref:LysM domain-containing protein n=1 Tax=Magnaporthiopsis poae (strain ATCC 64411 / 73-15) TaxID=644358 RepID=A0A0C4ECP9_MAGP6|nr:hypothetical protein MAPG_10481 [Magnaporthiopsis poae ATCC 64411]